MSSKKIIEFMNKSVQLAKYAHVQASNDPQVAIMIKELQEELAELLAEVQ